MRTGNGTRKERKGKLQKTGECIVAPHTLEKSQKPEQGVSWESRDWGRSHVHEASESAEREHRQESAEVLARLGKSLITASSFDSVTSIVREETEHLWQWDAQYIAIRQRGQESYQVSSFVSERGGEHQGPQRTEWPAADLKRAIPAGVEEQPLLIHPPSGNPDPVLRKLGGGPESSISRMYAPIESDNGVTGFIAVQSSTKLQYGQTDLGILQKVADMMARALERISAEAALRQSEERYRLLAENVTDLIWTMDMDLRLTYISPSITRIRGYSVEEAMQLDLEEVLTPSSFRLAMKTLQEELEAEKGSKRPRSWSRTMELEHVCKDGSTVWSEAKMTFLRGPDGRPTGILGVTRDITDRKRAEEALRQSEQKYRTLVQNIQDGVCIIHNSKIQFANEALARMLGYGTPELGGMDFLELVAPEDREPVADQLSRTQTGRDAVGEQEFCMLNKNRITRVFVNMKVGNTTYQGQEATIGTLKDVTQRRKAEEENQRLQEQLAHAQKIEALGTLSGGIAHEFNNINAAIIGYVDLSVQTEGLSDALQRNLGVIRASAVRGADLTKSLLTFSRKDSLEKQPVNLRDIVEEVLKVTEKELSGEGIKVAVQHAAGVPQVLGDAGMLSSVVVNLVVNARHAMLKSEVKNLTLRTGSDGGRPFVAVEDTGCGIPEENLSKLFDPFFTTKGSLVSGGIYDKKAQGTGLGLSVCHSIIVRHEGEIKVQSEVGRGTAFTICFPALSRRITTRGLAGERRDKHSFRVMVVDDEEAIADLLVDIVGHAGHAADGFTSPKEALEALRDGNYSLGFVDLQMPDMAGEALMNEIDSLPHDALPLRVIVTGRPNILEKDFARGDVFAILPKPFTTRQVLEVLERGLREMDRRRGTTPSL